jgi:hypothetical protein
MQDAELQLVPPLHRDISAPVTQRQADARAAILRLEEESRDLAERYADLLEASPAIQARMSAAEDAAIGARSHLADLMHSGIATLSDRERTAATEETYLTACSAFDRCRRETRQVLLRQQAIASEIEAWGRHLPAQTEPERRE